MCSNLWFSNYSVLINSKYKAVHLTIYILVLILSFSCLTAPNSESAAAGGGEEECTTKERDKMSYKSRVGYLG
jgi:hypothetical protein